MSQSSFKVNDAVSIDQKGSTSVLHGQVAYVGPVDFTDGDDWVGVRLTGSSIGKGKNNGSVQGKVYFDNCGPNGGVFVRNAALKRRTLSKLEELRLKRGARASATSSPSTSSSSIAGTRTSTRSITGTGTGTGTPRKMHSSSVNFASHTNDDDNSSVSSMTSMRSSATSGTNRSRLDEIRQRRLALQRNNKAASTSSLTSTPSTPPSASKIKSPSTSTSTSKQQHQQRSATPPQHNKTPSSSKTPTTSSRKVKISTTTPPPKMQQHQIIQPQTPPPQQPDKAIIEITHLKEKIKILEDNLHSSQTQTLNLQKSLKESEQIIHETKMLNEEYKSNLELVKQEAKQAIETATKATAAAIADAKKAQADEAQAQASSEKTPPSIPIPTPPIHTNTISKEKYHTLLTKHQNLQKTHDATTHEKNTIHEQYIQQQIQSNKLQQTIQTMQQTHEEEIHNLRNELTNSRTQLKSYETELQETKSKTALREDNNAIHYKERAKLQAEMLTWERKLKEAMREKLTLEQSFEDLTLDKEQIQESLESMEDKYEELKIDLESLQIEAEEMRFELEDARERSEKAEAKLAMGKIGTATATTTTTATATTTTTASDTNDGETANASSTGADAEDIAQALSIQNTRLREAIIRLREQSSYEKMELIKQLRTAEKEAELTSSLKEETAKYLKNDKIQKQEINELKEMVDQGSAFEQMVEDLSDRVLAVEDNNIALQGTIRELEEGGELSAEIEEAQADEIKALMKDLQNRDTVVLNLEEAIKMQRKRELDFQRTVGNYRQSIDTLQHEKNSLLALHQGDEDKKKDALISSQKALAQAAQSVVHATKARKREANATFNLIDAKVKSHLAERLENFLPRSVASEEISAVKGELLLSKIAMKASLSLNSVSDIFQKIIQEGQTVIESITSSGKGTIQGQSQEVVIEKISMSSNVSQQINTMIHQTKFTQLAIETSSECLRLLSISQWPDLLSSHSSVEFSIALSHAIPPVDSAISEQLLKLKEEGVLSPHRSNLNILQQTLRDALSSVNGAVDGDGNPLIPSGWNPPSLYVLTYISSVKFYCFGTASILASLLSTEDGTNLEEKSAFVSNIFTHVNNIGVKVSQTCDEMITLDITDIEGFNSLQKIVSELKHSSFEMFTFSESLFSSGQDIYSSRLLELKNKADIVHSLLGKVMSLVRTLNSDGNIHQESKDLSSLELVESLSPETSDPWESIVKLARKLRSSEGDADDINYLIRGKALEEQLSVAVENDAKLSISNSKVRSLEKNLATRSKEISMQNGRLLELENLLSQTSKSTENISVKSTPQKISNVSDQELKEEVRVLNEAMEVLQSQVDEYEKEIRSLKDPQKNKINRKGAPGSARKNTILETDFSLSSIGLGNSQNAPQENNLRAGIVEAALFRPALRSARADASIWKSKAIADTLLKLPPLSAVSKFPNSEISSQREKLLLASSEVRRRKANVTILELGVDNSARLRLREERRKTALAINRLEDVSNSVRFVLGSRAIQV